MSNIYLLQIALLIFFLFCLSVIKFKKIDSNEKFINFSLIIALISLFFVGNSSIGTRFILFSTTNSLVFLQDFLKKVKGKNGLVLLMIMLAFSLFYFSYQIISLQDVAGYGKLFGKNMFFNIVDLFLKK